MGLNGLPGGGPWRILAECPARFHNSALAAKKGTLRVPGEPGSGRLKCICPRGLQRLKEAQESAKQSALTRGGREPKSKGGRQVGMEVAEPLYLRNTRQGVRKPDLSGMECGTALGRAVMDAAADARWGKDPLRVAKNMCDRCLKMIECRDWRRASETAPGEWYGMYGGETHIERRKAAKREREASGEGAKVA